MVDLPKDVDPKSDYAVFHSVYGESEQKQKDDGNLPIDELAPDPVEISDEEGRVPPSPATGTKFEDAKKGSTWEVPIYNQPAHQRPIDLDPRVHGPFLDEVRMEEAQARAEARNARER